MGVKEEKLPYRFLYGYSGQSRPFQVASGKCLVCHHEVWVDPTVSEGAFRGTKLVHHGCKDAYIKQQASPPHHATAGLNGSASVTKG